MPRWSHSLPEEQEHMGFQLRRTPPAVPLVAIITCDELLVVETHYWGGRTLPCERLVEMADGSTVAGDCKACQEGVPYRIHVYVSAREHGTHDHFIFEMTAHAAKPLVKYLKGNRSLRGCAFKAIRPRGYKNGKVVITTTSVDVEKAALPAQPNMIRILSQVWRLPLSNLAQDEKPQTPLGVKLRKDSLDRMRNQPDNQPEKVPFAEAVANVTGNSPPKKVK